MNKPTFKRVLILASMAWLSVSCAQLAEYLEYVEPTQEPTRPRMMVPVNPGNPIRRVAILPVVDNSGDVEGSDRIREEFFKRLEDYNYEIQPLAETSEILNFQMGISMGKQLGMGTPQEIGKTLGVEGLFFGYLLDFDEITLNGGARVRMGWKLVDTKTGKISWGKGVGVERTQSVGGPGLGLNEAEKVEALPGSNDPMTEMPGLDRWISMGPQSAAPSPTGVLALNVTPVNIKDQINFAYDQIFPGLLSGPGGKVAVVSDTATK